MGLLSFNLLLATITITALSAIVFGVVFIVIGSKKGQLNKINRGIAILIIGFVLSTLSFVIDIHAFNEESLSGANSVISRTGLLFTIVLGWWFIVPAFILIVFYYFFTAGTFLKRGKDSISGEIISIEYIIFGRLMLILGIAFIVFCIGVVVLPPSFVA